MKNEVSNATLARNEVAREIGNATLTRIHRGEFVTARNPVPFEVTEANAGNIGDAFGPISNVNPHHDTVQRTFERREAKTDRANYRAHVHLLACNVADKHVRQAKMPCAHLRAEFVAEIESAIGEAIAFRMSRFPALASDLLARFACDALPNSTRRALHRIARKACDARMRRMSGATALVEPAFFNVFTDEPEQSAELNAVFVNARCDALLSKVRARASTNGNAARAARAHESLIETARAYFLASIAGDSVQLPAHGLTRERKEVGTHRAVFIAVNSNAPLAFATTDASEETGRETLTASALYKRIARLEEFIGGF